MMISPRVAAERLRAENGGSATRNSNELRPQDPGSGDVWLTASRTETFALPVENYGVVVRNMFVFPRHGGLLSGRWFDRPAASRHNSDGQHIEVVKVTAVLVDVTPVLVEEPVPTSTTVDEGDTDYMSPMAVLGDDLSMKGWSCPVCFVEDYQHKLSVYHISNVMASGDNRSEADRSGVSFKNQLHVPWNAPESIVTLDTPGVVVLDISAFPDVLGLRGRNDDAEPVRVLPGRTQNSVRVLIPDDRAAPWGFHDVTLTFYLDLGQLWRCPVSWCTQWKVTPQDCNYHICAKHHVGDSRLPVCGSGFRLGLYREQSGT